MLLCNYKNIYKHFFDSQDSSSPPDKIVENYKFELYVRCWGPICITVPNLIKIGQVVAEISNVTVFKMAAVCRLGFVTHFASPH